MKEQNVIWIDGDYMKLKQYFAGENICKLFLVCDKAFQYLNVSKCLNELEQDGMTIVRFDEFTSNPKYEEIVAGVDLFRKEKCDMIFAVGGGSAIDVAKCVKLYSTMDVTKDYLSQAIVPNRIPFVVMPTTAGTGSEATRYSVIYYNGEKQSITHESCIPKAVLLDFSVLQTLPVYQKKATMLDALCHALESFWSLNSTEESREYSMLAIKCIMENYKSYLDNDEHGCREMLKAANIAGKAINISQTTAGHAMCYKLTSLYGISHGHAAALCVSVLWPYMLQNMGACKDPRGKLFLENIWEKIALAMGRRTPEQAMETYMGLLDELELETPDIREGDFFELKTSVNPVRLKNNPVELTEEIIEVLYHRMAEKRINK